MSASADVETLEQEVLECAPGGSLRRQTDAADEVLFVVDGSGALDLDGTAHPLQAEDGAHLAPGEEYELRNTGTGPLRVVAVRISDPEPSEIPGRQAVVRRLSEQQAHNASAAREFRIVADPSTGLASATHFVGYIPTERAPDHFHTYNEVIYVLDGEGVLHAGGSERELAPGAGISLAARTVHCLENTGDRVMRVVAVFRPAGSPAAAYYPDGTPAHADAPALAG